MSRRRDRESLRDKDKEEDRFSRFRSLHGKLCQQESQWRDDLKSRTISVPLSVQNKNKEKKQELLANEMALLKKKREEIERSTLARVVWPRRR